MGEQGRGKKDGTTAQVDEPKRKVRSSQKGEREGEKREEEEEPVTRSPVTKRKHRVGKADVRFHPTPPRRPSDSPTCRTLSTQPPSSRAIPLRKGRRFSSAAASAAPPPPGAVLLVLLLLAAALATEAVPPAVPVEPTALDPPPGAAAEVLLLAAESSAAAPVLKEEYMQISLSLRGKDQ